MVKCVCVCARCLGGGQRMRGEKYSFMHIVELKRVSWLYIAHVTSDDARVHI